MSTTAALAENIISEELIVVEPQNKSRALSIQHVARSLNKMEQ